MAVPRKLVHWENISDISLSASPFGSSSEASSDFIVSTSSLDFINAQLVAHGFVSSPGISLEGISRSDSEVVIKCLLGMLSQRTEDMSRTEGLTTKLRTLSYDHERLVSMHSASVEKAANAEREMNLHKSRLATGSRSLQTSEAAHRHTTAELQRTRTSLQAIRSTQQSELRKREKEIERMSEKWSRLADCQAKLTTTPSGMYCANIAIVDGAEFIGKGQGYLEVALQEAERSRRELNEENIKLKKLALSTINDIQSIIYEVQCSNSMANEEPTPFTLTSLFVLDHPSGIPNGKFTAVLDDLRHALHEISSNRTTMATSNTKLTRNSDGEIESLQNIITELQTKLETSQQQSITHTSETQALFDQFAKDHRIISDDVGELSVELLSAPLRDIEKERLDGMKKQLDDERQKFTEAAIKLGKERAALEAERVKMLDERRTWQVEMMLADLPPTPQAASPSPKRSPRKSPVKPISVGKAGTSTRRKTTRVSRRSSASPSKVIPPYETEVVSPLAAPMFNVKLTSSLLPTSFVLPPPSPRTSLPAEPALPPPTPVDDTLGPLPVDAVPTPPSSDPPTPPAVRQSFPVAKPFAQRMVHAYSPVKPSPLSRILMLGNSPSSPEEIKKISAPRLSLESVVEDKESELNFDHIESASPAEPQQLSLAAELGVESPPESPLQEKKMEPNVNPHHIPQAAFTATKGRVFHEPQKLTAKQKGKVKAPPIPVSRKRSASAGLEKENTTNRTKRNGTLPSSSLPATSASRTTDAKSAPKPVAKPIGAPISRLRVVGKPSQPVAGPRRVPIDSAEAAVPAPKGRR
ncbi:Afadin and alpha-actinin-binding-domain-containing protein [Infundibulicybe gibba]|nr:Afadin and alpha-actinin-binding-domain-containing protein [Infundibulicybe gibba]